MRTRSHVYKRPTNPPILLRIRSRPHPPWRDQATPNVLIIYKVLPYFVIYTTKYGVLYGWPWFRVHGHTFGPPLFQFQYKVDCDSAHQITPLTDQKGTLIHTWERGLFSYRFQNSSSSSILGITHKLNHTRP